MTDLFQRDLTITNVENGNIHVKSIGDREVTPGQGYWDKVSLCHIVEAVLENELSKLRNSVEEIGGRHTKEEVVEAVDYKIDKMHVPKMMRQVKEKRSENE